MKVRAGVTCALQVQDQIWGIPAEGTGLIADTCNTDA